MGAFEELKKQLTLTDDDRLLLGEVPMILTPRWFFVGIMNRVTEKAGPEAAAAIYYGAGYDGAYRWSQVQMEQGLNGRAVLEQYLGSMTHRGWGRFEIVDFSSREGTGFFRFHNSAVARESKRTGETVCLWVPGALAGSAQAILDAQESALKVVGRESTCFAQGCPFCEFRVEPVAG